MMQICSMMATLSIQCNLYTELEHTGSLCTLCVQPLVD